MEACKIDQNNLSHDLDKELELHKEWVWLSVI